MSGQHHGLHLGFPNSPNLIVRSANSTVSRLQRTQTRCQRSPAIWRCSAIRIGCQNWAVSRGNQRNSRAPATQGNDRARELALRWRVVAQPSVFGIAADGLEKWRSARGHVSHHITRAHDAGMRAVAALVLEKGSCLLTVRLVSTRLPARSVVQRRAPGG